MAHKLRAALIVVGVLVALPDQLTAYQRMGLLAGTNSSISPGGSSQIPARCIDEHANPPTTANHFTKVLEETGGAGVTIETGARVVPLQQALDEGLVSISGVTQPGSPSARIDAVRIHNLTSELMRFRVRKPVVLGGPGHPPLDYSVADLLGQGASQEEIWEEIGQRQEQLTAAREAAEKTKSAEFVARAATEAGAVTTDSGLVYSEITAGTGGSPQAGDTVKVHYHGTLRDGTVFDSSVDRGKPVSFALDRVIPCWAEGVQRMKVGGTSRLVCPSDLAYGDRGPPGIPAGAVLDFEVELLEIVALDPQT